MSGAIFMVIGKRKESVMATIISATTRFGGGKRGEFLDKAHTLLAQARTLHNAGDSDSALENAYQAALRTAGARVAGSAVARKKRKPQGAWAQLALVDDAGVSQAQEFSAFSRLRARVYSGIEAGVDSVTVADFIQRVQVFIDFAEEEAGLIADVA